VSKRRLFIGASGPIGYDYEPSIASNVGPVPVLEDLNGILLCYDELIFLSREFCPPDMWDLPYVRFANEAVSATHIERLRVAAQQFRPPPGLAYRSETSFSELVDRVTGDQDRLIDNHSRSVELPPEWSLMGNAEARWAQTIQRCRIAFGRRGLAVGFDASTGFLCPGVFGDITA
jgi:hypothetical protein